MKNTEIDTLQKFSQIVDLLDSLHQMTPINKMLIKEFLNLGNNSQKDIVEELKKLIQEIKENKN